MGRKCRRCGQTEIPSAAAKPQPGRQYSTENVHRRQWCSRLQIAHRGMQVHVRLGISLPPQPTEFPHKRAMTLDTCVDLFDDDLKALAERLDQNCGQDVGTGSSGSYGRRLETRT